MKPLNDGLRAMAVALQTIRVSTGDILRYAESMGAAPDALVEVADCLLPRRGSTRSRRRAAVCLALGSAMEWKPLVPHATRYIPELLASLVSRSRGWDPLIESIEGGPWGWEAFCHGLLVRLGHPAGFLASGAPKKMDPAEFLPWMDQGHGLVTGDLELKAFDSVAVAWRLPLTRAVRLRDGHGPALLDRRQGACDLRRPSKSPTRLFRVSGLRALQGLSWHSPLAAVDCPDLKRIFQLPQAFILKDCPSLVNLPPLRSGTLFHVERCDSLRALNSSRPGGGLASGDGDLSCRTLILADCPKLRRLPPSLLVEGRMILRGMGPIRHWPVKLRIGGDLLIQDCPAIRELPPMEVEGSLRISGESGLRRLAPGTRVGLHLDLRACVHLEEIPHDVKVGGCLFLPPHLLRAVPTQEAEDPCFPQEGPYERLRDLLEGLCFADGFSPSLRQGLRQRGEALLVQMRQELREQPGLELELLCTASEAWQDLCEFWWAEAPERFHGAPFPAAWFRGLLFEQEPEPILGSVS